eukprot:TRINITY_DN18168_c0_g1_i1.p1 TRINITY_DN18168_c0_g1~~TRINITY_DN18168_c0_g1_i1.p1  ORF type:complete len:450 (-),score=98.85 TRINITY_DN18168_c0_g1_i1:80-1429(-)
MKGQQEGAGVETPSEWKCAKCGKSAEFDTVSNYLTENFIDKTKSFLVLGCPLSKRCERIFTNEDYKTLLSPANYKIYQDVWKTIPDVATCLADFHYGYNKDQALRCTLNGRKFHWVNQAHYDALGDFIYLHIQHLMKTEFDLEEIWLPVGSTEKDPRVNIFLSKDALTNPDRLLLLIQGSGAVRAGQWARALCINETLEVGSILPYLKKAKAAGYGVIVFNPNYNSDYVDKEETKKLLTKEAMLAPKPKTRSFFGDSGRKKRSIEGNDTPRNHVLYVWDNFVRKAKAADIAIVAHSAGGGGAMGLLRKREDEALKRLRAIAFTDSVHSVSYRETSRVLEFLKKHAINWVRSDEPLDTKLKAWKGGGCPEISAGHDKHEWTSGTSIESVFKFLNAAVGATERKQSDKSTNQSQDDDAQQAQNDDENNGTPEDKDANDSTPEDKEEKEESD